MYKILKNTNTKQSVYSNIPFAKKVEACEKLKLGLLEPFADSANDGCMFVTGGNGVICDLPRLEQKSIINLLKTRKKQYELSTAIANVLPSVEKVAQMLGAKVISQKWCKKTKTFLVQLAPVKYSLNHSYIRVYRHYWMPA